MDGEDTAHKLLPVNAMPLRPRQDAPKSVPDHKPSDAERMIAPDLGKTLVGFKIIFYLV